MNEKQKLCKKNVVSPHCNSQAGDNMQTMLLLSEGKYNKRIPLQSTSTNHETDTTLPDLSENNVAKMRWLEGDISDEDECDRVRDSNRQSFINPDLATPRYSSARKMLPRINDGIRVRRNIFNDPQSLCNRIKMSCNITPFGNSRRSSYTGIPGDGATEELISSNKPSIQGTGLLRKQKGEKTQLINADDLISSTNNFTFQRSVELKNKSNKIWSKSRPFIGRPHSGQPRVSKRLTSEGYASVDMTCVGSKIKGNSGEASRPLSENEDQKSTKNFRNIRAKSACFTEKTLR